MVRNGVLYDESGYIELGILSGNTLSMPIGSTRVTITRLLGELKTSSLLAIDRKKITIFDPIALAKRFN